MQRLLIATTNPGKLGEIKRFLSDLPLELLSLKDVKVTGKPDETGTTFEENAVIKAKYYMEKTGLPVIGDDGGFEIDALGGEPGVKSHRWINQNREDKDEELINYTFQKMKNVPIGERNAKLRAVLAFVTPKGDVYTATAATCGIIPDKPSQVRVKGFPFRSVLFIPEINKFYNHDILTPRETDKYNHRKKALSELKPIIKKVLKLKV